MVEKRKKGNGYEEVKEYVLRRLQERPYPSDPFVRIAGEEIAGAIGISAQMVNAHVRTLVRHGVFHRERRFYYSEARPVTPSSPAPMPGGISAFPSAIFQPVGTPVSQPVSESDHAVPTAESFLVPVEDILGTFTDISGKQYFVFRSFREISQNESEPSKPNFSEPSEMSPRDFSELSRNVSETSPDSKKEYQEKTNQIKKEKCVNFLGEWVDSTSEEYRKAHDYATKLFNRHGAGVRKGTNPKLISRFVAGFMLKIPLINFQELEEQLKEAEQETAQYESYKGFGKRSGIRRPYIRMANYLKKCFEAAGWIWTKLDTPFETRLKRAHQQPPAAPVFQQIQTEQEAAKPVPASQSVMSIPTETQILEAEPMPLGSSERKPLPVNVDKIIEQLSFKLPPDVRSPPGTRPVKPPS